jgi:DNA-binding CsgD family transcriptional regulator
MTAEAVRAKARRRPESNGPPAPRHEPPSLDDGRALSPREFEIARLIAKGYPNKTVAAILDISPWTVSTYLRRIYAKFGVRCRAAMVAHLLHFERLAPDATDA